VLAALGGLLGLGAAGGAAVGVDGSSIPGLDGAPIPGLDDGDGADERTATVRTLDAPGSTAGERRLPAPDRPTVLDFFATWCLPCEAQMRSLRPVHEAYGDRVAFVSVSNERTTDEFTREDLRAWWREHDGAWTLGHDPESRAFRAFGVSGLPYLVVTDAGGEVAWTHRGVADEKELRTAIDGVL